MRRAILIISGSALLLMAGYMAGSGRAAVVHARDQLGHAVVSERRACKVLGQPRCTQRRQRQVPHDEPRLVREMTALATQYGRYGYRRITAMLHHQGWTVNHKRIQRLWRREGLKVPQKENF